MIRTSGPTDSRCPRRIEDQAILQEVQECGAADRNARTLPSLRVAASRLVVLARSDGIRMAAALSACTLRRSPDTQRNARTCSWLTAVRTARSAEGDRSECEKFLAPRDRR